MIPGPVEPSKDPQGDFEKSMSRDLLGELVRDAWVDWAEKQPNPKPSWLVPWSELNETDREVDRRIGDALALWIVDGCIGRVSECQTIDEAVEALAIYTRTVPQFYLVHDTWDAARAAYEADEHSGIDTTFKEYNFPCTKCSKPVAAIGESMPSDIEFDALCIDCLDKTLKD